MCSHQLNLKLTILLGERGVLDWDINSGLLTISLWLLTFNCGSLKVFRNFRWAAALKCLVMMVILIVEFIIIFTMMIMIITCIYLQLVFEMYQTQCTMNPITF